MCLMATIELTIIVLTKRELDKEMDERGRETTAKAILPFGQTHTDTDTDTHTLTDGGLCIKLSFCVSCFLFGETVYLKTKLYASAHNHHQTQLYVNITKTCSEVVVAD